MRTFIFLLLLFSANAAMSSARIVHPWRSVKLATDNAVIEARTNSDGSRLTWLQVEIGKHAIKVPNTAFAEVANPRLHTIQVMWNCSHATGKVGSQEWRDSCKLYVSIEYDDSINGRTLDEDCPRMSFVFKQGEFVETTEL
jgi:hypothetical protein